MCEWFAWIHVRAPCACPVPSQVRRGYESPGNWSYRWSWGTFGCWWPNSDPQTEQALITAELSLQTLRHSFYISVLWISHHSTIVEMLNVFSEMCLVASHLQAPPSHHRKHFYNRQRSTLFLYKHLHAYCVSSVCFWELNGEQIILQGCPWRFIEMHLKYQPWKLLLINDWVRKRKTNSLGGKLGIISPRKKKWSFLLLWVSFFSFLFFFYFWPFLPFLSFLFLI